MRDRVPVAPFRDRYVMLVNRGELSAKELARRLEWLRDGTKEDTRRVQAALGLRPYLLHGNGRWGYREKVNHDTAVKLAKALEMDPVEAGL